MSGKIKKYLCPIMSIMEPHPVACFESECRLWIHIKKESEHPSYILVYEGCGLIKHIPWRTQKIEQGVAG